MARSVRYCTDEASRVISTLTRDTVLGLSASLYGRTRTPTSPRSGVRPPKQARTADDRARPTRARGRARSDCRCR